MQTTILLFAPTWLTILTIVGLTIGTVSTLVVWAAIRANKRAEDSFYRPEEAPAKQPASKPQKQAKKVVKHS